MDRCALAHQYHKQGYSCAQSVAGAFADLTGWEPEQLFAAAGSFGGGVGGSHEELCGAISILYGGRTAFSGPAGQLRRRMNGQRPLLVRFAEEPSGEPLENARGALRAQLKALLLPGKDGLWEIVPCGDEEAVRAEAQDEARTLRLLMAQGLPVCAFYREETSLEEIFMEVVRDDAQSDL